MPRKTGRRVEQPTQDEHEDQEELGDPEEQEENAGQQDDEEREENGWQQEDEEQEGGEQVEAGEQEEDGEPEEQPDYEEDAKQLARNILDMKEQLDHFLRSLKRGALQTVVASTAAKEARDAASFAWKKALEAEGLAAEAQGAAEDVTSALDAAGVAGTNLEDIYRQGSKAIMRRVLGREFDEIVAEKMAAAEAANQDQPDGAAPGDEAEELDSPAQQPDPDDEQDFDGAHCHACDDPFNNANTGAITCRHPACGVQSHRRIECSGKRLRSKGGIWFCDDHRPLHADEDAGDPAGRAPLASTRRDRPEEVTKPSALPASGAREKHQDPSPKAKPETHLCAICEVVIPGEKLAKCTMNGCQVHIHSERKRCFDGETKSDGGWKCWDHRGEGQPADMQPPPLDSLDDDDEDVEHQSEDDEDGGADKAIHVESDKSSGTNRSDKGDESQQDEGAEKSHRPEVAADEDPKSDQLSSPESRKKPKHFVSPHNSLVCDKCSYGVSKGPLDIECSRPHCRSRIHEDCHGKSGDDFICRACRSKTKQDESTRKGNGHGGNGRKKPPSSTAKRYSTRGSGPSNYCTTKKNGTNSEATGKRQRANQFSDVSHGGAGGKKRKTDPDDVDQTPTGGLRANVLDKQRPAKSKGQKRSSDDDSNGEPWPKKAKKDDDDTKSRNDPKKSARSSPTDDPVSENESEPPVSAKQKKEYDKSAASLGRIAAKHSKMLLTRKEKQKKLPTSPNFITRATRSQTTEQAEAKADEEDAKKKKGAGGAAKRKPRVP